MLGAYAAALEFSQNQFAIQIFDRLPFQTCASFVLQKFPEIAPYAIDFLVLWSPVLLFVLVLAHFTAHREDWDLDAKMRLPQQIRGFCAKQ